MEFKEQLSPSSSSSSNQQNHPHSPPNIAVSSSPTTDQSATQKRRAGRKKFQETRHPVYKGVRRRNGKWVCELRQPNNKSRIWLGTFPRPQMAARAHDVAALALRGNSVSLNFPESAHLLPRAKSSSIRDIQRAAMEAADQSNDDGSCGGRRGEAELSSPSSISSPVMSEEGREKRMVFLDEEELFNMPTLLDSMAEGLILTPPAMKRGFNWNDEEDIVDLALWSD